MKKGIKKTACLFGHKWNGCMCEKCGKKRDQHHDWENCKCKRCGQVRDEAHNWQHGVYCSICGRVVSASTFVPTEFAFMPLTDFQRFLSPGNGLIHLLSKKKGSPLIRMPFIDDKKLLAAKMKEEEEIKNLFIITSQLLNLYLSRAMSESNNPSKTFDDLLDHYALASTETYQHLGKYSEYGESRSMQILQSKALEYLKVY